jgi:hypothetical protein
MATYVVSNGTPAIPLLGARAKREQLHPGTPCCRVRPSRSSAMTGSQIVCPQARHLRLQHPRQPADLPRPDARVLRPGRRDRSRLRRGRDCRRRRAGARAAAARDGPADREPPGRVATRRIDVGDHFCLQELAVAKYKSTHAMIPHLLAALAIPRRLYKAPASAERPARTLERISTQRVYS